MQTKTIRYYHKKLSPARQHIYEQILTGLIGHEANINITGRCSGDELSRINEYVLLDHPCLFYVGIKSIIVDFGGKKTLRPSYCCNPSVADDTQKQIDAKVSALLRSVVRDGADVIDKERAIYAHLAQNTKYNHSVNALEHANHSIAGPLLNGLSVCEGYAKAFKYLCDAIKLPCVIVGGTAIAPHGGLEPHAWNIVKVKGACYHIDVTWDSVHGDTSFFDYFNLSDGEMSRDHTWDKLLLPPCDTEFSPTPCVNSKKEFERFILNRISIGETAFQVRFNKRFDDGAIILDIVQAVLDNAPRKSSVRPSRIEVRYNENQNKAVIRLIPPLNQN